jgi:hypothetical protein
MISKFHLWELNSGWEDNNHSSQPPELSPIDIVYWVYLILVLTFDTFLESKLSPLNDLEPANDKPKPFSYIVCLFNIFGRAFVIWHGDFPERSNVSWNIRN